MQTVLAGEAATLAVDLEIERSRVRGWYDLWTRQRARSQRLAAEVARLEAALKSEVARLREQVGMLCDAAVERDAERELNADSRAEAIDDYREMKSRAIAAEREAARLRGQLRAARRECDSCGAVMIEAGEEPGEVR